MPYSPKPTFTLPSDATGPEWEFLAELLTEWFAHYSYGDHFSQEEHDFWFSEMGSYPSLNSTPSRYYASQGHVVGLDLKFWQDGPSDKILRLIPQIIEKLPYLTSLTLEYDYLPALPDTFLQKCPELTRLHLGGKLLQIPDDFFAHSPQITSIRFSNMPMNHIPPSLVMCSNINTICLHLLPNLAELPLWITHFPSLHQVELLSLPSILALPDTFDHCPNFQELIIKYCPGITTLPPTLRALPISGFRYVGYLSQVEDPASFRAMPHARICDFDTGDEHYP